MSINLLIDTTYVSSTALCYSSEHTTTVTGSPSIVTILTTQSAKAIVLNSTNPSITFFILSPYN